MKIALFSFHISGEHAKRLEKMVGKPLMKCKVCFITTTANPYRDMDEDEIPLWLQVTVDELNVLFETVNLFDVEKAPVDFDFKTHFLKYDCVFVGGGNVFYLSYMLRKLKVDEVLKDIIRNNKIVYAGGSAGAVILARSIKPYETIDDPKDAPKQVNDGLGLIDFVPIVHWEDEKYFEKLKVVKEKYMDDGVLTITLTDTEALFIENEKIDKL